MSKTRDVLERLGHLVAAGKAEITVINEERRQQELDNCKKYYYGHFVESQKDDMRGRYHVYPGKFSECLQVEKTPGYSNLSPETKQQVQQHCKDQIFEDYQRCVSDVISRTPY